MGEQRPNIAVLGGTGALGGGLAARLAAAGYAVIVGSRNADGAAEALTDLRQLVADLRQLVAGMGGDTANLTAAGNLEAAKQAQIAILTVPFAHQTATLQTVAPALAGKILIDATVPLVPPKVGTVQMPAAGSAGQAAQAFLGEDVRVVSAFQNVAAAHLREGHAVDCDVLVCGNDKDARTTTIALVEAIGMRGFHAGPIANAVAAEALTSVLITINRTHKAHAGIRISGLPDAGNAS